MQQALPAIGAQAFEARRVLHQLPDGAGVIIGAERVQISELQAAPGRAQQGQPMDTIGPMMQGMMNNYIDQSKSLFVQMQEQMQSQSKNIFGTFPFVPGVAPGEKK